VYADGALAAAVVTRPLAPARIGGAAALFFTAYGAR
jgi:hypothetical protein